MKRTKVHVLVPLHITISHRPTVHTYLDSLALIDTTTTRQKRERRAQSQPTQLPERDKETAMRPHVS